jgi:hypothetical protein
MTEPEPVQLPRWLAAIIAMYANANAQVPVFTITSVQEIRGIGAGPRFALHGTVTVRESGEAVLSVDGRFDGQFGDAGTALEIFLSDGSVICAPHSLVTRRSTSHVVGKRPKDTTEAMLREWRWSTSDQPLAWIGLLHGAEVRRSHNLFVHGHGRDTYDSVRLDGNSAWHLTRQGAFGRRTCVAIIDTKGAPIDRTELWQDFAALEFVFGTALRLDLLVGVNEKNDPVAAFGTSFGYRYRPDAPRDPPFPDEDDAAWIAGAFPLIVRALKPPMPNPVTIATCGYVDSTVGHLDGQYLFAQLGLRPSRIA